MSRTKVDQASLDALLIRVEDLSPDIRAVADVIRKHVGYDDDVTTPLRFAAALGALATAASDASRTILLPLQNEEMRHQVETAILSRKDKS